MYSFYDVCHVLAVCRVDRVKRGGRGVLLWVLLCPEGRESGVFVFCIAGIRCVGHPPFLSRLLFALTAADTAASKDRQRLRGTVAAWV